MDPTGDFSSMCHLWHTYDLDGKEEIIYINMTAITVVIENIYNMITDEQ